VWISDSEVDVISRRDQGTRVPASGVAWRPSSIGVALTLSTREGEDAVAGSPENFASWVVAGVESE
jgi:hypothetical protein